MLSAIIAVAFVLILANLFLILILFFLFFRAFFKFIGEDTLNNWTLDKFVPKSPLTREAQNEYTPKEGEVEVPLEDFQPDFTKPIEIKYEEAGDEHGLSIEEKNG